MNDATPKETLMVQAADMPLEDARLAATLPTHDVGQFIEMVGQPTRVTGPDGAEHLVPDAGAAAALRVQLARLDEVGHQLALGTEGRAPGSVLWRLTNGAKGTAPTSPDEAFGAILGAQILRAGFAKGLASRYLAEAGLDASQALDVAHLEEATGIPPRDFGQLSREDVSAYTAADRVLRACGLLLERVALHGPDDPGVSLEVLVGGEVVLLTPEDHAEAARIRAAALGTGAETGSDPAVVGTPRGRSGRLALSFIGRPDEGLHLSLPSAQAVLPAYRAIIAAVELPREVADARLAAMLRRPDGTSAPALRAWLRAQGQDHSGTVAAVVGVLAARAQAEWREKAERLERERNEEKARADELARQNRELAERTRELEQLRNAELPPFTRMPLAALDNITSGPRWHAKQLALLEERTQAGMVKTRPSPDDIEKYKAHISANPNLWDLSVSAWRLLHAVYALYAASGVNGDDYAVSEVPEDWPRLYMLAGIPETETKYGRRRSGKRTQELKAAVHELTRYEVPVFVPLRKENNRWDVATPFVKVLDRVPIWEDLTDEEKQLLEETKPEDPRRPSPTRYLLRLPPALRKGLDTYFREVPTDLWLRLERACGDSHPETAARFALKLYQLSPSKEEPGVVRLSRDSLAEAIPFLGNFARRRQWARFESAVSSAAQVLVRAGILSDAGEWEVGKSTGKRQFVCRRAAGAFPGMLRPENEVRAGAAQPIGADSLSGAGAGHSLSGAAASDSPSGAEHSPPGAEHSLSGAEHSLSGAVQARKSQRRNNLHGGPGAKSS